MNNTFKKMIWYPGSAGASRNWIVYLQKTFKGAWIFSDNSNFDYDSWDDLPGKRMKFDTLSDPLPDLILNKKINTLVISHHPGLRDFASIQQSELLLKIKPDRLIYDPGSSGFGDIERHLAELDSFSELGYSLEKIIVLPRILEHQYCDFVRDYSI